MKDFKFTKHGNPAEVNESVKTTKYMQRFKGKRKINFSRLIYILVLLYLIGVVFFYLAKKIFYVSGKGVVVSSKYIVNINTDISLKDYWVSVNERVKIGDTLFSYQTEEQIKEQKIFNKDRLSRGNTYLKTRNDLDHSINLKKIRKRHYLRLRRNKKILVSRLKKEVYLDVSKRDRLEISEQKLIDINSDIKFISEEIRYLEKSLSNYKSTYLYSSNIINNSLSGFQEIKYLTSPVSGKILNRYKLFQFINKNDAILDINKDEGVVIIANVSQNSMNHIYKGTELFIEFSDGIESKGIVKEIIEPSQDDEVINTKQLDEMTKIQLKIIPIAGEEKVWLHRISFTVQISKSIIF